MFAENEVENEDEGDDEDDFSIRADDSPADSFGGIVSFDPDATAMATPTLSRNLWMLAKPGAPSGRAPPNPR